MWKGSDVGSRNGGWESEWSNEDDQTIVRSADVWLLMLVQVLKGECGSGVRDGGIKAN